MLSVGSLILGRTFAGRGGSPWLQAGIVANGGAFEAGARSDDH